jgi:hypothetical protein
MNIDISMNSMAPLSEKYLPNQSTDPTTTRLDVISVVADCLGVDRQSTNRKKRAFVWAKELALIKPLVLNIRRLMLKRPVS